MIQFKVWEGHLFIYQFKYLKLIGPSRFDHIAHNIPHFDVLFLLFLAPAGGSNLAGLYPVSVELSLPLLNLTESKDIQNIMRYG